MSSISQMRAFDEVVAFCARGPSQAEIASFQLSEETKARVRVFLPKHSAGTLTPDESEEPDQCVQLDRMVTLIRLHARQEQQEHRGA